MTHKIAARSFAIEIALGHKELDIKKCPTEKFGVLYSWNRGETVGGLTKNSGYWRARIREGSVQSEFQSALEALLEGLEGATAYLCELKNMEAKLEVIFIFRIQQEHGKVLEIELSAEFLEIITRKGFSIRVECFSVV